MRNSKRKLCAMLCAVATVSVSMSAFAGQNQHSNREADNTKEISAVLQDESQIINVPDAIRDEGGLDDGSVRRVRNEENDLNTIVYENESGSRTMYVFEKAVKYVDEDGVTKDKSTTFEESDSEDYAFENGNNDVKLYLNEDIEDGVMVEFEDNNITMSVENADDADEVKMEDNTAVYDNVFGEGTSVNYKPLLDGIKEEIVLKYFTGQTEFEFIVETGEYELAESDDNCLYLKNPETNETVGIIDSVYMIDANGETDFNNYYKYEEISDGQYKVTACVNKEFLESPDTAYPVVIDPTITIAKSYSTTGIYDATINSKTGSDGYSGSLFVGNRGGIYGESRAVMKFPGLFTKNTVSVVLKATVSIRDLMCQSTSMNIACFSLLEAPKDWTESNVSWSLLKMSSHRAFYPNIYTTKTISHAEGVKQAEKHRYEYDITQIVSYWRKNPNGSVGTPEQGIVFKSVNSTSTYKTFGSYNRSTYTPVFKMEYIGYNENAYNFNSYEKLLTGLSTDTMYNPNCLGLALHQGKWVDFDDLGMIGAERRDVDILAERIVEYIKKGKWSNLVDAKVLTDETKSTCILNRNQYLIAVRVHTYGSRHDLHAIAQLNNGRWVDKHGISPLNQLGYIDPEYTQQSCWYDSGIQKYYDSKTVYILITAR